MRLRRRNFRVQVALQTGEHPILLGFGFCTIESSADDARQLALDLAAALEQLQHRGGDLK